jgi:hypothetical protein
MQTKECRKIKAHDGHKHLTFNRETMSNVVLWCDGRDYDLLLAHDVLLESPHGPTDGETCECHHLVWNFRDLKDGLCPFAI